MPRTARAAKGGIVYHVLNRGNGRQRLFHKPGDYDAFVKLLAEGKRRATVELFAFCLMPNHWHLVLRPRGDADLARFVGWVSNAHVRRHHAHHRSVGGGHVYQGRFKAFPVQEDHHLLTVLRYVESNARRAGLVTRAAAWRWGSAAGSRATAPTGTPFPAGLVDDWPVDRPRGWAGLLDEEMEDVAVAALRRSVNRGRPFGDEAWTRRTARRLALGHTLRPRGRPRKRRAGEAAAAPADRA
jgi:putative transposase